MEQKIQFNRPDGEKTPAYYFQNWKKNSYGLILIQEWWGINSHMKSVAERLAAEGYAVLVPDLFRGKVTQDPNQANEWMSKLDFVQATKQDLQGAENFLHENDSKKVGVIGFCMGGALTIAAAAHVKGLNAAVCFYGIPPQQLADPTKLKIPIQFHFANIDEWCTPAAVNSLEAELKKTSLKFELYRYEAQHAFFNDTRPEVYDSKATELAWERSLGFLKKHL